MTGTLRAEMPVLDPGAEPVRRLRRGTTAIRVLVHVAWIAALTAAAVARIGRFGFNPADQGFILALSWRVLHGEIPHTDIVSPRPLGSALLHTIDFAIPGPLLVVSGAVMMVQLCVATLALAALVTGESPLRWGPLRTLLVATAALVNLHNFPMMAWHTVDGIFLTALGLWLLDSGLRNGSALGRRSGLVLLGSALIIKQSFALVAPLAVLILLLHPATRGRARNWLRLLLDMAFLAAVPLAYFMVVTVSGGLDSAVAQLTGGAQVWGEGLFTIWQVEPIRHDLLVIAALMLGLAGTALVSARFPGGQPARVAWLLARLALVGAATAAVIGIIIDGHLTRAGDWAFLLTWALLFAAVLDTVVHRRVALRPLCLVLLAWMCSLSWGYPSPTLLAGSLALATIELLVRAGSIELPAPRWWTVAGTAAGVTALLVTANAVAVEHDRAPYFDLPQGELTADLGDTTPELKWVRTHPSTHTYVEQIRDCTARYPAARVAILPDNPFAYPAFGLRNPFPMDWLLTAEVVGDAHDRMLERARSLDREGGYLVLFQTVGFIQLAHGVPVPDAVSADTPIVAPTGLENAIKDSLTGQQITCGSFIGVWSPR